MTASTNGEAAPEAGRTTSEGRDRTNTHLHEPAASRTTLARRLRAVERALADTDGEFEELRPDAAVARGEDGPDVADLDAVEERLAALERAVRAVHEHLVSRDRARRAGGGLDSVERAVEALPDPGTVGTDDGDATVRTEAPGSVESGSEVDRGAASAGDESAVEWVDRVAGGGVAPPQPE